MTLIVRLALIFVTCTSLSCKKAGIDTSSPKTADSNFKHFQLDKTLTESEELVRQCYLIIKHYGSRLGQHGGQFMQVCESFAALPESAGKDAIETVKKSCDDKVADYESDQRVFGDDVFRKSAGQEVFKGNCALLSY